MGFLKIDIYLRFALMGLLLVGGVAAIFIFGFWWAFPFILAGLILTVGYFLFGTIQSASQLLQDQKFAEAEKRLALTIKPNWLYTTNRAYYHILKATIAMQRQDFDTAEESLKTAQSIQLNTDDERAMVQMQLIHIYYSRQQFNKAKYHLDQCKKLKITQSVIRDQLKNFDQALEQRGQMKHMMGMNPKQMRGFRQKRMR